MVVQIGHHQMAWFSWRHRSTNLVCDLDVGDPRIERIADTRHIGDRAGRVSAQLAAPVPGVNRTSERSPHAIESDGGRVVPCCHTCDRLTWDWESQFTNLTGKVFEATGGAVYPIWPETRPGRQVLRSCVLRDGPYLYPDN